MSGNTSILTQLFAFIFEIKLFMSKFDYIDK